MIRINLLPEEFRPVKKSILPYFLALVVLFLGIIIISFIYMRSLNKFYFILAY